MKHCRPIRGWTGYYEVSASGTVYSLPRKVRMKDGRPYTIQGGKLQHNVAPNGYLTVRLSRPGKRARPLVHRLVALAWIPNPGKKPQVNHKDGDAGNPKRKNLEWCTQSENALHACHVIRTNWPPETRKLSNDRREAIRRAYQKGVLGFRRLAKQYGVDRRTIRDVVFGYSKDATDKHRSIYTDTQGKHA